MTITTPDGAPVDAIDLSRPGDYVVRIPVEDDGAGSYYVVEVDWRVGYPPEVGVNPVEPGGEVRPLEPDSVGADAAKGTVHGTASDSVAFPVAPGERETAATLLAWAEGRYRVPADCTMALDEVRDATGRKVTMIDKGVPSEHTLVLTVADDRGNATTLTVRYALREVPTVAPKDPDSSDLEVKDPIPGEDDKAHQVVEEKVPIVIDPIEVGPDQGVLDDSDVLDDVRERYEFGGEGSVEVEIRDPEGAVVDGIDTSRPGTYDVKVTLTGPRATRRCST